LDKHFTTNRRLQISLALDFLWSYHYCRVFEGNSLLTLMRTSLPTYLWAPVACLILFVAFASNAAETTVASILANRRPQLMPKDAGGSVVLVEPHIVEGRGVLRPNHCAGRIGHNVGEVGPGVDNADPRGVELRPGFVCEH
jgi:hypothetical protein